MDALPNAPLSAPCFLKLAFDAFNHHARDVFFRDRLDTLQTRRGIDLKDFWT